MAATLERLFDRARLLRSGMTDPLTGWNSRRYLHARLCEEIARCRRQEIQRPACSSMSIACAASTSAWASRRATACCANSARDIEAQVRSSDTFAHLGGDQFAVLLPGATAAQAVPLAERILCGRARCARRSLRPASR